MKATYSASFARILTTIVPGKKAVGIENEEDAILNEIGLLKESERVDGFRIQDLERELNEIRVRNDLEKASLNSTILKLEEEHKKLKSEMERHKNAGDEAKEKYEQKLKTKVNELSYQLKEQTRQLDDLK